MSQPFKLSNVMKLRQRERDKAAGDMQEIRNALALFDAQMDKVRDEAKQLARDRKEFSLGSVVISNLIEIQRYELQLSMQYAAMKEKRQILVNEQTRRESVLLKCQQNLKAIEVLEEQHKHKVRKLEEKALQGRLDEWSNTHNVLTSQETNAE